MKLEIHDYVNWYNKHRIHGTLGYMSPVDYRKMALEKLSSLVLTVKNTIYDEREHEYSKS